MRVGFVGLGDQGGPIARRIIDAGYPVTLYARRAATLEPFADSDAKIAGTLLELGAASDLLGVCVMDDAGVEEVLTGDAGALAGMEAGGVVIIHSTVHPDTCRRMEAAAADRGVAVLDAPVSGGGAVAAAGNVTVMVGGDEATFERCRPVFETYAGLLRHLGPLGSGQLAKLLNNLVFIANVCNGIEVFDVGEQLGIDRGALAEILGHSSGASFGLGLVGAPGSIEFLSSSQLVPTMRKDVDLVSRLAGDRGIGVGGLVDAGNRALTRFGAPPES